MGPYQRTPKKVTRAIKYPGLGVRSVGPVEISWNLSFRLAGDSASDLFNKKNMTTLVAVQNDNPNFGP